VVEPLAGSGETWRGEAASNRAKFLPRLSETGKLLTAEGAAARFGHAFYEQLQKTAPAVNRLFDGKTREYQAIKLGEIVLELIRLVELDSPDNFHTQMELLAMRHVDYGADRKHGAGFSASLLAAIRIFSVREGGRCSNSLEEAWKWVYDLAFSILFAVKEKVEPKVLDVRSSFQKVTDSLVETDTHASGVHVPTPTIQTKKRKQEHDTTVMAVDTKKNNAVVDPRQVVLTKLGQYFVTEFKKVLPQKGRSFVFTDDFPAKIGTILDLIVDTATRPKVLERRLRAMATRHIELGVGSDLLAYFRTALYTVLERSLGGNTWSVVKSSWDWLWSSVHNIFMKQLDHWRETTTQVNASWKLLLKKKGDAETVAFHFFNRLDTKTAVIAELFKRPVAAQARMFGVALQMLVDSATDSEALQDQVGTIAMKHVKFDLKPWMFQVFGEALLEVLAEIIGDEWTEGFRDGWLDLYDSVAQIFIGLLDRSKSLMTRGLAKTSLVDVKTALATSARQSRCHEALVLDMDGESISPLLWSLRDGFFEIARALIADVTALRADRARYYYGVEELWTYCPDIFTVMCKNSPDLVTPLLDGHLWVSNRSKGGYRNVNMWIKHIYGVPDSYTDVFAAPLGDLVDQVPESHFDIFSHPIIQQVVSLKWLAFARKRVLAENLLQLQHVIIFTMFDRSADTPNMSTHVHKVSRVLWVASSFLLLSVTLYTASIQIRSNTTVAVNIPGLRKSLPIPRYLMDVFPWMRISVATSSIYFAFRSYMDPNAVYNHRAPKLSAYVSFVQWMLMFEFFKLSKTLSATAFVGLRMTTMALRFVVVLILWLEAMGVAILHLIEKDGLLCSKYPNSPHECEKDVFLGRGFDMAYKMFASSVGHENEVLFYSAKSGALVRTLFAGALWVAIVIILNILVASMVSAYAQAEAMRKILL